MNNKALIGVVITIILVSGVVFLFSRNKTPLPQPPAKTQPTTSPTPTQQTQNTVTYTSSGFSPVSLTIKVGTTVTWINNSDSGLSLNSNPHPLHTNYSPLNIGAMGNGQSKSLTFDKPGTYAYHNHLNPSDKGTVIVQ